MPDASLYRRTLATAGFFTLAAGDFWRYTLTWWGWGAIVALLFVLGVVELIRTRVDLRRLPLSLWALLALMLLSTAWSAYPGWTAAGVLATLVTTVFAAFLALCLPLADTARSLGTALRWILGLSLAFELLVALVIRHHVLPLWTSYPGVHPIPNAYYWSRDLLLHGGQIQGIVGNSNLLALVALLSLIVSAVQLASRSTSRIAAGAWGVIALVVLGLTRSSTVLAAGGAVLVVAILLVVVRRRTTARGRRTTYVVGGAILVAGALSAFLARGWLLALLDKSDTLTGRTRIWSVVLEYAAQRPIAGWGWVSYWVPWVHPFDDARFVIGHVRYSQAHDAWLDVLLQLGAIGLVVFAIFIVSTLARSWVLAVSSTPGRDGIGMLPVLLMVALLVHSIAESRILIEIGFALVVICSIVSARREAGTTAVTV